MLPALDGSSLALACPGCARTLHRADADGDGWIDFQDFQASAFGHMLSPEEVHMHWPRLGMGVGYSRSPF